MPAIILPDHADSTKPARPSIRCIPTRYSGCLFRSRLEARWAVCLDELSIYWEHEPEGYSAGGVAYLPDFWLPQVQMFAEVKPNDDPTRFHWEREALDKAVMLATGTGYPVMFLDGMPRVTNYWAVWPDDLDPVGWDWNDVDLFDENEYHLCEGRFFSSTGLAAVLEHAPAHVLGHESDHPAVHAARAARFERF